MLYRPGKRWLPASKTHDVSLQTLLPTEIRRTKTQKGLQGFLFPTSNILTFQRQPSLLSQQEGADNSRESCIPALDTLSLMKS